MNDTEAYQNTNVVHQNFLLQLFNDFNKHSIGYCIPRNFESLPVEIDGDLDILISADDLDNAENIIRSLLGNIHLIKYVRRNDHIQYFMMVDEDAARINNEYGHTKLLILDLMTDLQWKGIPYLSTESVLSKRRLHNVFYITDELNRAAHILCHALLDKNHIKPGYKAILEKQISLHGDDTFIELVPAIGPFATKALTEAVKTGNEEKILSLRTMLIKSLLSHKPLVVVSCLKFLAKKYFRITHALLFPPGILVASAGPDGSGKTTLMDATGRILNGAFNPVKFVYMGWKEFILPTKRVLRLLQNTHNKGINGKSKPNIGNLSPPWTHNLSVLHYFIDLWARYLFRIRPALSRGGLVLCDRYFYDILIQDVWLCNKPWARSLLLSMCPTPSLTIIFSGNPQKISQRKNENSPEETKRQLSAFSVLQRYKINIIELDAESSLKNNIKDVVYAIIQQSGKQ